MKHEYYVQVLYGTTWQTVALVMGPKKAKYFTERLKERHLNARYISKTRLLRQAGTAAVRIAKKELQTLPEEIVDEVQMLENEWLHVVGSAAPPQGVDILLRGVPHELHAQLKQRAKRKGVSLNTLLLDIMAQNCKRKQ
ncbi:hypothetical protein SAMN02746041_03212 [Desulfacinum hydrothermale DSM 13146]|uniref:HicB family protein n=1 Tax=Desulfacinum hydrothermale DSM 13146 TaxID=1121390 RepID=A0A1W1XXH8_9BACT|nr:hypothetical protein [Desulfacinum hydrothermale]SMC28251.1 hypothetical protein SAMN02746041_03212 [Desulfacinum hydrothermale DSM 13146]